MTRILMPATIACLFACAVAESGEPVPADVLASVKKVVPKGWTVTADVSAITVRRDKKVGIYNAINIGPSDGKRPVATSTEVYQFVLTFRPAMTAEQYDRLEKANAATDEKLEKLRNAMRVAMIAHKFDDWLPDTDEQKKLVASYRSMRKRLPYHRLPDLYTEQFSIDLEINTSPLLSFADPAEQRECMEALTAVRGLFRAYRPIER